MYARFDFWVWEQEDDKRDVKHVLGPFIFHLNIFVCGAIVWCARFCVGWLHKPRWCTHTHTRIHTLIRFRWLEWFIVVLVYLYIKCWYEQIITATTATTTIKIITACSHLLSFSVQTLPSETKQLIRPRWVHKRDRPIGNGFNFRIVFWSVYFFNLHDIS